MIHLTTLGGLDLFDSAGTSLTSVLSQPKRVALLAYLVVAQPRGFHRRDTLFGLFWPDSDYERARGALNQAVYYLRRSLGPDVVINRGDDDVGVDASRLSGDAAEFEDAIERGDMRRGLELYRGDLLPGFFLQGTPAWEHWLEVERARLRGIAAGAAWTLSDRLADAGDVNEAVYWARRAVTLAPDDEVELRRLIGLLERVGDRAGAVQAFEDAVGRFDREYGIQLSDETLELMRRVRSVAVDTDSLGGMGPGDDSDSASSRNRSSTAPLYGPSWRAEARDNPVVRDAPRTGTADTDLYKTRDPRRTAIIGATRRRRAVAFFGLAAVLTVTGLVASDVVRSSAAAESERLARGDTDRPEARRAYLRGRNLLGRSDPESLLRARDYFIQAVEVDPAYALAWSGLSDAWEQLAGSLTVSSSEGYPRARAAAERALSIDPDLAAAHTSLAMALTSYYWDSGLAEQHFRRAIELDPDNAHARRTYAGHLRNLGRFEEALIHAEAARDLDPIPYFSHFELLVIPYFKRRFDIVLARADSLLALDPAYGGANFLRALALVQKRQWNDALSALDEYDPRHGSADAAAVRAHILARTGRQADALRYLDGDTGTGPDLDGFQEAVVRIALDDKDLAMEALRRAYRVRSYRMRLLGQDPLFDPLRADPRFKELLRDAGLTGAVRLVPDPRVR